MGITQAQLSRIENGPPLVHLDRLIQWARVLRIPSDRLWFAMPDPAPESGGDEHTVKRRNFFAATGMTAIGRLLPPQPPTRRPATGQAAQWLAWRYWQLRASRLECSQVPATIARGLDVHPQVVCEPQASYRFTDPALIDLLVAKRIFGGIAAGDDRLLATAQTSHATDLRLGYLTGQDQSTQRELSRWMRHGATAVLRVNAAGVLSKAGSPELGDAAIGAIRGDHDVRHLYLTAVASRVLAMSWEQAEALARVVGQPGGPAAALAGRSSTSASEKLCAELRNPRDAAARWCSTVLLRALPNPGAEAVRAALARAAQHERCRENLRTYAAVLADTGPIT